MLAGARRGFKARFEREAAFAAEAAGETLSPAELARRAERLRRSHMLGLAARSAAVRRRKTGSGDQVSEPVLEVRRGPGEPAIEA
jgi:hypothetical protein